MTSTYDLAVLVCGAKKPCPDCLSKPGLLGDCARCQGERQVYILGERARRPCRETGRGDHHPDNCYTCRGRNWFPTILHPDGSVCEGLLRELLEEAGYKCSYLTGAYDNRVWHLWEGDMPGAPGATLLETAAKALGVEVKA